MQVSVVISENIAKNTANYIVHFSWSLQEKFYIGSQQTHLYAIRPFSLIPGQQLYRILNHLPKLADYLNGAAARHLVLCVFDQIIENLRKHREILRVDT